MTEWPIDQLKPYHRQEEFFPESKINTAKRQALLDSIVTNGLDRPIRITRDGTIMDGFHRWQIAQELGWDTIPVEVLPYEPDSAEAQRIFLESNIGSVHDDPMVQARLLQERVKFAGVREGSQGKRGLDGHNVRLKDIAQSEGMEEKQLRRQLSLNKLIPPLQALVSAGKLGTSNGAELAVMTTDQQQALYDAIGESVTTLKRSDIQAAKQSPDTSALEAQIAALAAERNALQSQVKAAPDPELLASLQDQLAATDEARQEYADELAHLKEQSPVERIVEKVVTVEKPVVDPAQAAVIAKLESDLAAAQKRIESLVEVGDARQNLVQVQTERKAAEKALKDAQSALGAVYRSTEQQTGYRAAVGKFVDAATKRARPILSDWQRIAEHPRHSLNWGLYYDVQALAGMLESVAAGLRLLDLDPVAAKKHHQRPIMDTTATTDPAADSQAALDEGGLIDVDAYAVESTDRDPTGISS